MGSKVPREMRGDHLLAVESSCDETAAAVIRGDRDIVSNVISSQVEVHSHFGGVVPELASRHHLVNIVPVVREALSRAKETDPSFVGMRGIRGIAVSRGPGLVGSLMVGLQTVKGMCLYGNVPLVGVNHLEAHLEAVYGVVVKEREVSPEALPKPIPCPHVALLVSGGHSLLLHVKKRGCYEVLGGTRDDAAGEAFDKVAKMLGLGYPGGVIIDRLSRKGDREALHFPRALPGRKQKDFSFSGLKTAVRNHLEKEGPPEGNEKLADFCASLQEAIVDALLRKTKFALQDTRCSTLVLAGGVAANSRLRQAAREMASSLGWEVFIPPMNLCTDNAAMVGVAGSRILREGGGSQLDVDATCRWLPGESC